MENLKKVMERKEREFTEEIDYFMNENSKLRKKLGLPIDEDFDYSDVSIIEDDEELNGN